MQTGLKTAPSEEEKKVEISMNEELKEAVKKEETVPEKVVNKPKSPEPQKEVKKDTKKEVKEPTTTVQTEDTKKYDKYYVNDHLPKDQDQNVIIGSMLKLNSELDTLKEIARKNPELGGFSELRRKLSMPVTKNTKKGGVSIMSYGDISEKEESLMHKRDWYKVWGNEGKPFPEDTDMSVICSPQESINLALDQVRSLILAGFKLRNNRTGDIINKRRLDKYIAEWSKDKNPIL